MILRGTLQKAMALALVFVMTLGAMPFTTTADDILPPQIYDADYDADYDCDYDTDYDADCGAETELPALAALITGFAPLPDWVTSRAVPFGTSLAALNLPAALTALVPEPATPTDLHVPHVPEMQVPVTWTSLPPFNGNLPGMYVFTAVPGYGFALAEGVTAPQITVLVEQASITPIVPMTAVADAQDFVWLCPIENRGEMMRGLGFRYAEDDPQPDPAGTTHPMAQPIVRIFPRHQVFFTDVGVSGHPQGRLSAFYRYFGSLNHLNRYSYSRLYHCWRSLSKFNKPFVRNFTIGFTSTEGSSVVINDFVAELVLYHGGSDNNIGGYMRLIDKRGEPTVPDLHIDLFERLPMQRTSVIGHNPSYFIAPWEVNLFLSAAVGDFNGDGSDEIAIYIPEDTAAPGGRSPSIRIYTIAEVPGGLDLVLMHTINLPDVWRTTTPGSDLKHRAMVDMSAGDLTGTGRDSLVVAISRHCGSNIPGVGGKNNSALLIYHPSGEWLPATPTHTVPLVFQCDTLGDKRSLRRAGVSIADIDGDGELDIFVAGVSNTHDKDMQLDPRLPDYYTGPYQDVGGNRRADIDAAFFDADGMPARGDVRSGVLHGVFTQLKAADANREMHARQIFNNDHFRPAPIVTATANHMLSPFDFETRIFASGAVLQYHRDEGLRLVPERATVTVSEKANNTWFQEAWSGNFYRCPNGAEQFVFTVGSMTVTGTGFEMQHSEFAVRLHGHGGLAQINGRINEHRESTVWNESYNPFIDWNVSATPMVGFDNPTMIRFSGLDNREVFYSDPNLLAILQAAPMFRELAYFDDGYLTAGNSRAGWFAGRGTEETEGSSFTGSTHFGVNVESSFFGLFKTGYENREVLSRMTSEEFSESEEQSLSVNITSYSDNDRVVLAMTENTRYRYEIWLDEGQMPTQKEYDVWVKRRADLNTEVTNIIENNLLPVGHPDLEAKAKDAAALGDKIRGADYLRERGIEWGAHIPAGWWPIEINVPGPVVHTVRTVDQYNEVADAFGLDRIDGKTVFPPGYRPGVPQSYRQSEKGQGLRQLTMGGSLEGTSVVPGVMTVTNSGHADIEIGISHTHVSRHTTAWNESLETQNLVSAGYFTAGYSAEWGSSGGFSKISSSGVTNEGTVSLLPDEADGYSFDFQFFTHVVRLNGTDVTVLEFLVPRTSHAIVPALQSTIPTPVHHGIPATAADITFAGGAVPRFYAEIEWRDEYGQPAGATFDTDTEYTARFTLTAHAAYSFSGMFYDSDISGFKVNGIPPEFVSNTMLTGGANALSVLSFDITFPPTGIDPLVFSDSPLFDVPESVVGVPIVPFNISHAVEGGRTRYGYLFYSENLEPLAITSDGTIYGTFPGARTASTATIIVRDYYGSRASIIIDIGPSRRPAEPANLTTRFPVAGESPAGTVSVPSPQRDQYSAAIEWSGFGLPGVFYPGQPYTGTITLTAADARTFTGVDTTGFTVNGMNVTFVENTGRTLVFSVQAIAAPPPSFGPHGQSIPETPQGVEITPIDMFRHVTGGSAPLMFEATGLPPGITINVATGVISGAPTAAFSAGTATITVTDRNNASATTQLPIGRVAHVVPPHFDPPPAPTPSPAPALPTPTPQPAPTPAPLPTPAPAVTVTFDPDGGILQGAAAIHALQATPGSTLRSLGYNSLEAAGLIPEFEGYFFAGWLFADGSRFTVNTPLRQGDRLTASRIILGDVTPDDWYFDAVRTVVANGLFQGTGEGLFEPYTTMSRAMFTQVLANLAGIDTSAEDMLLRASAFSDVASGSWYNGAVNWAARIGICPGVGEGMFAPEAPITRETMAGMLLNFAQIKNIPLPRNEVVPFADQHAVSPWAEHTVRAIQAAGIIQGRGNGLFDPQATATRAEVAAIFAMFLQVTQ